MPVSNDEMVEAILRPMHDAYKSVGITPLYLAKKHKSEMNASLSKAQIPKNQKEFVYSKKLPVWDTRQKARQDAQHNMGYCPPKNHKINGIPDHISITFTEDFGIKK